MQKTRVRDTEVMGELVVRGDTTCEKPVVFQDKITVEGVELTGEQLQKLLDLLQ